MTTNDSRKRLIKLRKENGSFTKNKKELLEEIHKFYTDLYQDDHREVENPSESNTTNEAMCIPKVLPEEVERAIKETKPRKAGGLDGVTNDMLKSCGRETHKILADLFNKCVELNSIPVNWEDAKMILIHKKGDQADL